MSARRTIRQLVNAAESAAEFLDHKPSDGSSDIVGQLRRAHNRGCRYLRFGKKREEDLEEGRQPTEGPGVWTPGRDVIL